MDASSIRLSQSQLNLLSLCPRKFQHVYLEQLGSPDRSDQQERQLAGTRFHLLMQQWQLGLPVEPVVQGDEQLLQWFKAFLAAAPAILSMEGGEVVRQVEYDRTLQVGDYLLTGVYDLLLSNAHQAKILDWKTYPRPQNPQFLLQNWQTRLYLYLLAETSAYAPEQISMVYWFFQSRPGQSGDPQSLQVRYDSTKHEQTRGELNRLLQHLTDWLEGYQRGEAFPQVAPQTRICDGCSFAVRCDRSSGGGQQSDPASSERPGMGAIGIPPLPALADIQEIPL